jgi:hypothetical protein
MVVEGSTVVARSGGPASPSAGCPRISTRHGRGARGAAVAPTPGRCRERSYTPRGVGRPFRAPGDHLTGRRCPLATLTAPRGSQATHRPAHIDTRSRARRTRGPASCPRINTRRPRTGCVIVCPVYPPDVARGLTAGRRHIHLTGHAYPPDAAQRFPQVKAWLQWSPSCGHATASLVIGKATHLLAALVDRAGAGRVRRAAAHDLRAALPGRRGLPAPDPAWTRGPCTVARSVT